MTDIRPYLMPRGVRPTTSKLSLALPASDLEAESSLVDDMQLRGYQFSYLAVPTSEDCHTVNMFHVRLWKHNGMQDWQVYPFTTLSHNGLYKTEQSLAELGTYTSFTKTVPAMNRIYSQVTGRAAYRPSNGFTAAELVKIQDARRNRSFEISLEPLLRREGTCETAPVPDHFLIKISKLLPAISLRDEEKFTRASVYAPFARIEEDDLINFLDQWASDPDPLSFGLPKINLSYNGEDLN